MNTELQLSKGQKIALVYGVHTKHGTQFLENILSHKAYKEVIVFCFQELKIKHEKLTVIRLRDASLDGVKPQIMGHDLFIFQEEKLDDSDDYIRRNYLIPLRIAVFAKHNKVNQVCLLSSVNTILKSVFLPHKTKEELEKMLERLDFWAYHLYRPLYVSTPIGNQSIRERIANFAAHTLNRLSDGKLQKIMPIDSELMADIIIENAQGLLAGIHRYNNTDIINIIKTIKS